MIYHTIIKRRKASFNVEIYEKSNGYSPFLVFLDSQSAKIKAKVLRDITLLEEFGNKLREPYSKYVGKGFFELRTRQGTDIIRSLYFFFSGHNIVITNGFVKKTQTLPSLELKTAIEYRDDWTRRHSDEIQ